MTHKREEYNISAIKYYLKKVMITINQTKKIRNL